MDGIQQRFAVDGKLGGLQAVLGMLPGGQLAAETGGEIAEAVDACGQVFFLDHCSPLLARMMPGYATGTGTARRGVH